MSRILKARYSKEILQEQVELALAIEQCEASRSYPTCSRRWQIGCMRQTLAEFDKQHPAMSETELELATAKGEMNGVNWSGTF